MTDHTSHEPDTSKTNGYPALPANASTFNCIVYWLGIGLGSGLPRRAPKTWGTVGGFIVAVPLILQPFIPFSLIVFIAFISGIFICGRTAKLMDVRDSPHIVWNNWVGLWIAMLPVVSKFKPYENLARLEKIDFNFALLLVLSFMTLTLFLFLNKKIRFLVGSNSRKVPNGAKIMLSVLPSALIGYAFNSMIIGILKNIAFFFFAYFFVYFIDLIPQPYPYNIK